MFSWFLVLILFQSRSFYFLQSCKFFYFSVLAVDLLKRNDQGHIPEDPDTFHAVRNELPILSCSRMRLVFKMDMNLTDVPLPQNEEFPPPLQSLAIRFSNTSIWYGPEHDQYRYVRNFRFRFRFRFYFFRFLFSFLFP